MPRGLVYLLQGYIGKASLRRSGGHSGLAARLSEHLQALLHPAHKEGMRLRYRMMRKDGLRMLRFMPVLQVGSTAQALAAVAPAHLRPGGLRHRPP